MSFSFYLEDDYEEYLYSVTILLDEDNHIVKIEPMVGRKLISEDAGRVRYKKCRTNNDHYFKLQEILNEAAEK